MQILRKGELQVNNLERGHQLAALSREIATAVTEMTVDPATGRKHTVGMVEKTMNEMGFSTKGDKTAKAQALDLIRQLSQPDSLLPVQRVRMRVRITMPSKDAKRVKEKVLELVDEVEEEEMDAEWEAVSRHSPPLTPDCQDQPVIVPRHHRSRQRRVERQGQSRVHGKCGGIVAPTITTTMHLERTAISNHSRDTPHPSDLSKLPSVSSGRTYLLVPGQQHRARDIPAASK